MALSSQSYTFDPRPNFPLLTTAKRYWRSSSSSLDDPNALTLICTHGTGFHKEHWEPAIEDLYALFDHLGPNAGGVKIREVWSIDAPNHGDAAILNEVALQWSYDTFFWEDYGRIVHAFLAGLGTGVDVDFGTHKLVALAHSMGAVAAIASTTYQPAINYSAIHLVEPLIFTKTAIMRVPLEKMTTSRRDIWPSRDAAHTEFMSKSALKAWDPRVLRIYADHGLRPLPTADYPDQTKGVTLKCTKAQELACYRDVLSRLRTFSMLASTVKRFPVHIIYGTIPDFIEQHVKDEIVNTHSDNFVSVARIEGAGHLIIETHPKQVAEKLRDALLHPPKSRSKL